MKYQALRPYFFSVGRWRKVGWGWWWWGMGGGVGGVGVLVGWGYWGGWWCGVLVRVVVGGGQRVGSV